jgi:FixJ family two-component response regulator
MNPPRVCIVDDDASVRRSLVRLFQSEGLISEAYASARAYLDSGTYDGPSCLVLDVRMPELTGLDLQRVLIESGSDEQIIFITGNGDIQMCAHAMKAGAVDFLPKPFDDAELLVAVKGALFRSGERRRKQAARADATARIATLSPRQFQVFEGVIAGKLSKQIAADLGTALKTVKIQRGQVMEKMRVQSVAELVELAHKARANPNDS